MLKYEKIIRILSIEEKVELITSNEAKRNRMIENYMIPEFKITTKSYENNTNETLPSYHTLGTTWNVDLMEKVGKKIGNYNITHRNGNIVGVPANIKGPFVCESFSSEVYAAGKMAASMLKGLDSANALGCVTTFPRMTTLDEVEIREEMSAYEMAVKEGKPYSVYTDGIEHYELLNDINYNNLLISECNEPTEIIKAFYDNCDLVINENAKEVVLEAIEKYKTAKIDLYYKKITKIEFDELQRKGEILNPELVDIKLDELLEHVSLFDEKMLVADVNEDKEELEYDVACESLILLKNNGVLPLQYSNKAYIVGEAIESCKTNGDINVDSILNVFADSDLNVVGASHGYSSEFIKNDRLIEKTLELTQEIDADSYIVFLYANENEFKLPEEQLKLIDKLYENGKRIIAVLQTENVIDYSFVYKCCAVLQTGLFTNATVKALCGILCGAVNPSARTIDYCSSNLDVCIDKFDKSTYEYPLGYGLSYSSFEYTQLNVSQKGVTFIVKNVSHIDGIDVPQMYVEYIDENHKPVYKRLKGFTKVYIRGGESVKVFMPFDEYTFRTYNSEAKCYEIKAGKYRISVGANADNSSILSELILEGKLFDINGFKNEDITEADDNSTLNSFLNFEDRKEGKAIQNGISKTKKIVISSIVALYYNILMISLLVNSIINANYIIAIVLGVFVLAFDVFYIIYLIKCIKSKNVKGKDKINDAASIMLGSLAEYSELAKVTYPKPIPAVPEGISVDEDGNEIEEVEEEILEQEEAEELEIEVETIEEEIEEVEEEPVFEYDLGVADEYLHSDVEYDETLDIERWVKQFVEYASSRGLIIEHKSARALLASIASSRLVILRSVSFELLPLLQQILFEFVDSKYEPLSFENVNQYSDLLWTLNEDKYVCSGLVNSLYRAKALKNHINLCALENVDFTTFEGKFGKLFNYLSSREDEITINLGQEDEVVEFVVPKNMVFIATANNENYLETLPKNVAECSLSIELALRTNEIFDPEANVNYGYMSYKHLEELMKYAKDKHYIYEKQWKKFDDVEEQVNELSPFSIHNKTVLCFESLAGFILSCGVEIDEFLDLALASRIAPLFKSLKCYEATNGDSNLYNIITKLFGEDNVPQTKRTLHKPL